MKLLYSSILMLSATLVSAQTNVSGLISSNTTWTLGGSPYVVGGSVVVGSSAVLTVEAGVDVLFDEGTALAIQGELRVNGTQQDSVSFLPNTQNPHIGFWGGIQFLQTAVDYDVNSNTGCQLNYAVVKFAGDTGTVSFLTDEAGVSMGQTRLKISNCSVVRCNIGAYIDGANGTLIQNSRFEKNFLSGIYSENVSNTTVLNSEFSDNGFALEQFGSHDALVIIGSGSIIQGNKFLRNKNGGMGINGLNNSVIRNLFFQNSHILLHSVLAATLPGGSVLNNLFVDNSTESTLSGLVGIDRASLVRFNQFVDNVGLGTILSITELTEDFRFNTVCRNSTLPGNTTLIPVENIFWLGGDLTRCNFSQNISESIVYAGTSADGTIDLNENWWGTVDEQVIQTEIYDFFDNSSLAIVDYGDYLTQIDTTAPVTPPVNVSKHDIGNGEVRLCWDSNAEVDIAGYRVYYGVPTGYSFSNMIDVGNLNTYTLSGVNIGDSIAITAYDIFADGSEDQFDGNESWFTYAEEQQTDCILVGMLETIEENEVVVYPNPSRGVFEVSVQGDRGFEIEAFNMLGQSVYSKQSTSTDRLSVELRTAGVYQLRIQVGDKFFSEKVVVQ